MGFGTIGSDVLGDVFVNGVSRRLRRRVDTGLLGVVGECCQHRCHRGISPMHE